MHILWVVESTHILDNQREAQLSVLSIDETWSCVELYNRYRRFYKAVIVGVLAYVVEVSPKHLIEESILSLKFLAIKTKVFWYNMHIFVFTFLMLSYLLSCNNVFKHLVLLGLEFLFKFLFDFGLLWLGFRKSIRKGDAKAIVAALSLFRATGKYKYLYNEWSKRRRWSH